METEGKVLRAEGSTAVVEIRRKGACSGNCVDCSGCSEQVMEVVVYSEFPVCTGDRVTVASEQRPVLFGLFVLFILPLALPAAAYLLTAKSGLGGLFAGIAAAVAVGLIWLLSKSKWFLVQTKPKITGVIEEKR